MLGAVGSAALGQSETDGMERRFARGVVNAHSLTDDNGFTFYLGCNVSTRLFSFSFDNDKYRGKLLETRQDVEKPYTLVIRNLSGENQSFPVIAYYTDADLDNSWIQKGNLPTAFLDAFSQGARLTVQTGKASRQLPGASKAPPR